ASSFEPALAGKFAGAWWLHLLTRDLQLDFFLAMSSVSSIWGTEGYGPYAAANGGLDALAWQRRALGLPATSISFGPWAVAGMADDAGRRELARMGVASLSEPLGCASLRSRADGAGHLIACSVEWSRFLPVIQARGVRPLFSRLGEQQTRAAATEASSRALQAELGALGQRPRKERVGRETKAVVASILGYHKPSELREEAGFFDLGLDSIMAVDLTKALSSAFGVDLAVSDIFDHPTVQTLSARVLQLLPEARPAQSKAVFPTPSADELDPCADGEHADTPTDDYELSSTAEHGGASSACESAPQTSQQDDAIAIVGLAGRFPGADSLDELWEVLREGRDTVGKVPSSRWDSERTREGGGLGVSVTSDQGGFLRDIARFDSPFFGIAAREADSLDPQHRLLLEVAWHALEGGSIDPKSLKGSRTGVFVGISNSDYARVLEQGGLSSLDAYFGTGTALNAAAGRIAYLLGLHGPALAVDTACSSSLVALHLAVQSLRRGETDCMLAGGVNVITAPSCSVAVSRAHMLSPEGRCKTFSADADGFVRAEGCGVVVLKRLRDAVRDGNRVLALIHGTAVNQDGASSGLTVPSGKAQEAVIRAALADAKLSADAVSYLETHGTGTSLGDPIEVHAAWAALSEGRKPSEPLMLGSIKSNIGHCESASGMASLIKTVLALLNRLLPASLHAESLNPNIKWSAMNLRVVDTLTPWPNGKPRIAGISGFGFSGTNAHVLVGEAPVTMRPVAPTEGPILLPWSAPDATGLARLSAEWRTYLEDAPAATLPNVAYSAAVGRAHLPVRRAILANNKEDLLAQLKKPGKESLPTRAPRVAFLFSGQGSQYFGMGRDLYEREPVFRDVIDRADRILSPLLGASLRGLMFYGKDPQLINQTRVTQPALVVIELALAALWESWGVTASAVMGHSVGEIAAAIYAGVLEFEAGLSLIAERARLMQSTAAGAMLAVSAPLARVEQALADTTLDIAAINGPDSIVVAGTPAEIDALAVKLKAENIIARPLVVSHAFHSRLMEPILPELRAAIATCSFGAPELPLISNLTGKVARAHEYDADYFCRHVREPVRYFDGAKALFEQEIDVCLELGPDRTLINLTSAAGLLAPADGAPSLRRGSRDGANILAALKCLYEHGQTLDWTVVYQHSGSARMRIPLYPFAGPAHWTKVKADASQSSASARPATSLRHWGTELRSPQLQGRAFAFERTAEFPAYLTDHRLYGTVVTPAASHLATILSALGADGRSIVIEDLICPRALVIKDGERYDAQILLSATTGSAQLSVQSLLDPDKGTWQEHLGGRIVEAPTAPRVVRLPVTADFIASAERHIDGKTFYRHFRDLGYTLGPSFCWIADVWIRGAEALVRYAAPELPDALTDYQIYPGLIDSCFQSIAGFMVDEIADEAASLAIPFAAQRLSFVGRPTGAELWGHVSVKRAEPLPNGRMRVEVADLHMFDADGA
ncbi:MAG: polyketide synthase, partial [Myxococcaceae bacterium]|nr:polyketide synthase [Myxococcaceae bacterium]